MSHRIGGKVAKVAIAASPLPIGASPSEQGSSDPPAMAMKQVMGILLSHGDVRGETAIEKIKGIGGNKFGHGRGNYPRVGQYLGTQLQMDTSPPGNGFRGEQNGDYGKQQENHGTLSF